MKGYMTGNYREGIRCCDSLITEFTVGYKCRFMGETVIAYRVLTTSLFESSCMEDQRDGDVKVIIKCLY